MRWPWSRRRKNLAWPPDERARLLERADAANIVVASLIKVDQRTGKVELKRKHTTRADIETAMRHAIGDPPVGKEGKR